MLDKVSLSTNELLIDTEELKELVETSEASSFVPLRVSISNSADREEHMANSVGVSTARRRPGRPSSSLKKVTITVRIPADVDTFLTGYSDRHGLLKGDVIADAVKTRFHLNPNHLAP